MLGDLRRNDQRATGELYARGLLTDGQRKSIQPMAARLGTGHQRLQQFITSSTWDYAAVRRNVAQWFAGRQPVDALVVDDTGFPEDGDASPCVARQYSGTLGKTGSCQIGVSAHLACEHASCAADWRLFCPESWDDAALEDPVQAARAASRRARAGIPGDVRHQEKCITAVRGMQLAGAESFQAQHVVPGHPSPPQHLGVTPPSCIPLTALPASAFDRKRSISGFHGHGCLGLGMPESAPCPLIAAGFCEPGGRVTGARSARVAAPQAPLTRPSGSGSCRAAGQGGPWWCGIWFSGSGVRPFCAR